MHRLLYSETELTDFAAKLICQIRSFPFVIYLLGDLGAGKTTFVRGALHGLGYSGSVKSPTYTLLETYAFEGFVCLHWDLYRLNDPEELEFLGIRDYMGQAALWLIEWADLGRDSIPAPDLTISLEYRAQGRYIRVQSNSECGSAVLKGLA